MQTIADGINIQGTVNGFDASNIAIVNAGDDTYAIWGGSNYSNSSNPPKPTQDPGFKGLCGHNNYYGPTNINFTNILGHQYDYSVGGSGKRYIESRPYGTCISTYGFQGKVDISGLYCSASSPSYIQKSYTTWQISDDFCAKYNGTLQLTNITDRKNKANYISSETIKKFSPTPSPAPPAPTPGPAPPAPTPAAPTPSPTQDNYRCDTVTLKCIPDSGVGTIPKAQCEEVCHH